MQNAPELKEEVTARKETVQWEGTLRLCPCCKSIPRVENHDDFIRIMCSKWLCRVVEGRTINDAAMLWNEKSFRDK